MKKKIYYNFSFQFSNPVFIDRKNCEVKLLQCRISRFEIFNIYKNKEKNYEKKKKRFIRISNENILLKYIRKINKHFLMKLSISNVLEGAFRICRFNFSYKRTPCSFLFRISIKLFIYFSKSPCKNVTLLNTPLFLVHQSSFFFYIT